MRFPRYVVPVTVSIHTISASVFGWWGGVTGWGSGRVGRLLPTVLEEVWEGEWDRMEEGVFEKPFDEA